MDEMPKAAPAQPDSETVGIAALPKVELHLHLDCSLSYDVVHRLDPSVSLATFRKDFVAPAKCHSLVDFLTRPPRQIALMQTQEQLHLATLDVFEQLRRDGVIYAELRFAPLLHTEQGLAPDQVVAAVDAAVAEGTARTGVDARLILCTLRHFTCEQGLEAAELAARFAAMPGSSVVAIDLAGDEAGFPIEPHVAAFEYAGQHGLARTAHAGEALGAASVRETLTALHPTRIGHGARSIEDPALVESLCQSRVHLEVCPTSNVQTNLCTTYADHPINHLYQAGVSLGVSTDTRTVTNVTLRDEYTRLSATFGWTAPHLLRCNLDAVAAAFAPQEVKASLERRLRAAYGDKARQQA
jgi:adenosine deaminase